MVSYWLFLVPPQPLNVAMGILTWKSIVHFIASSRACKEIFFSTIIDTIEMVVPFRSLQLLASFEMHLILLLLEHLSWLFHCLFCSGWLGLCQAYTSYF